VEGVMINKTKKTPELANRLEKLCRVCEPKPIIEPRSENDIFQSKGKEKNANNQ